MKNNKPTKITMKRRSNTNNNSLFASAIEDELLVASILLDLPNIIAESESSRKLTWACKKRRTSLQPSAQNPHAPSPFVQVQQVKIKQLQHSENGGIATNCTPFSTDRKSDKKGSSKIKTKREELLVKVQELTWSGDVIREIQSVRKYCSKLLDENARLKSKWNEVL